MLAQVELGIVGAVIDEDFALLSGCQIAWLWAPNPQSRQYAWYSQPSSNDDDEAVAIELTAVAPGSRSGDGDGDSSKDSFAITGDSDDDGGPPPKRNKD